LLAAAVVAVEPQAVVALAVCAQVHWLFLVEQRIR
jgi:hypothetical protein